MTITLLKAGENMAYELTWHITDRVLLLSITGDYTLDDAKKVNTLIKDHLDEKHHNLFLLIDATHMHRPMNFQSIRETQSYMDHDNLKYIYVVASDKLIKLTMMVIFHLSRARVRVLDDFDRADTILRRQLSRA